MPGRTVSRRMVVGVLGSGVALAPVAARALAPSETSPGATPDEPTRCDVGRALVAPLRAGGTLGGFSVVSISPIEEGAVTVVCRGDGGHAFKLEILARDRSPLAPRPPAGTSRFAVFVQNGGDGWAPTAEEQGLTAMALAKIIAANEASVSADGFLTHAERIARHRESLMAEQQEGPTTRFGQ